MYVLNHHILEEVSAITMKSIYHNLANRTMIFIIVLDIQK